MLRRQRRSDLELRWGIGLRDEQQLGWLQRRLWKRFEQRVEQWRH
jgi:hypothetical protein